MNPAPLSARLAAVAALVPPTAQTVADIGCDHGLLSVALAARGHTVYAVDVSPLALERCRKAAAKAGVLAGEGLSACPAGAGAVMPLCGDGLEALPAAPQAAIIAGLGAGETLAVLRRGESRIAGTNADAHPCPEEGPDTQGDSRLGATVILAPASRPEQLRAGLRAMGYVLQAEELVYERRRFYPILAVRAPQTPSPNAPAKPLVLPEDWLGPLLLSRGHPLLPALAARRAKALRKALLGIPPQQQTRDRELLAFLEEVAEKPVSDKTMAAGEPPGSQREKQ